MNARFLPKYQARIIEEDGTSNRKLALYRKPDAAKAAEIVEDLLEEVDSGKTVIFEPWAD